MAVLKESAEEVEHFPQQQEDKSEEAESGEAEAEEAEEEGSEKPEEDVKGGETRDLKKKGKRKMEPSSPVTLSSSSLRPTRERKSVDRFYTVPSSISSAAKPLSIQKGRGMQLRDIPNVAYKLSKRKPDENLQALHNILYGKKAKARNLKKNIGQFSGYTWAEDELEKQRGRLRDKFDKCVKEKLLDFCDLLNVPAYKSSTKKEELTLKLLEFLESPHITTDKLLADKAKKIKNQRGKVTKAKRSIDATADIPAKKPEGNAGRKRKQSSEREEAESSPPRSESEDDNDDDDASEKKDQKETISEDDDMELEGAEESSKEKKRKNQRGKVTKTKLSIDATADIPVKKQKPEGKAGRKRKQSSEREDAESSPPRSESEDDNDDDDASEKKDQKETISEDDDMELEGAEESFKEKKRKNQRGKVTKTKSSIDATADIPAKKPKGKAGRKRKQSSEREDTESIPPRSESEEEEDDDANDKKDQKGTISEDNGMELEGAEEASKEDPNSPKKDYGISTQDKDISVKSSQTSDKPTKESSSSTLKRGDDPSINPEVKISKQQKTDADSGGEDKNASVAEKASLKRKEKNAKVENPDPSKEEIYAAAVNILKSVNFDTATLNDIIRQLGCQFGVDFKPRKAEVKAIVTEAINDMSGDEEEEDGDDESAELKS